MDLVTPMDQIEKEAQEIDSFLNIACSEDMAEVIPRGQELVVYIARTGKLLADSKWHKNKALCDSILKQMGEQANIPPSVLNKLVDAACKRENYLVDWLDRLNRSATHQVDWLRTLVSKAKEEMRLAGMNPT